MDFEDPKPAPEPAGDGEATPSNSGTQQDGGDEAEGGTSEGGTNGGR